MLRTLRRATAVIAIAACALAGLAFSGEEPPEPHLTDVAGDANGLNGQGLQDTGEGTSTGPASYGMADFTHLRFATLSSDGVTPEGLIIRLGTTDPLTTAGDNLLYRIYANVDGCPGRFEIDVRNIAYGDEIDFEWYLEGCGGTSDDAVITGVTFDDERWTIETDEQTGETVMTIPFSTLPDQGLEKVLEPGTEIYDIRVEVRHVNSEPSGTAPYSVVVPVIDEMLNGDFYGFVVGEDLEDA